MIHFSWIRFNVGRLANWQTGRWAFGQAGCRQAGIWAVGLSDRFIRKRQLWLSYLLSGELNALAWFPWMAAHCLSGKSGQNQELSKSWVENRNRNPERSESKDSKGKVDSYDGCNSIFRYDRSIFCLPHWPNFSDIFDLCIHWVSVVRGSVHCESQCSGKPKS